MSTPLLAVRDLHVHFPVRRSPLGRVVGQVRAVDGVSLEIARGETLGLVGESGGGKSTLGKAMLGLIEPTLGSVHFDGEDLRAMDRSQSRAFRKRAQIVFQDPFSSLNPRMTAGVMLGEALSVHGLVTGAKARRHRVRDLLSRVGLNAEDEGRYPHEFSGGQRQRLGIARALSVEPELIICDEPVSALDVSVQAQVLNLLEDLQLDLGLTYLFIAHDLAVVKHVSDRVAVMYLGRIVESAPVHELHANPLHPYTRALLSAVPRPDGGREGGRERIVLTGEVPSPTAPPSGCPFHPRCPHPGRDGDCARVTPVLQDNSPGRSVACLKV